MNAMKDGRLREIVMGRMAGNPSWMSALRSIEKDPPSELLDLAPTYRRTEHTFVTYRDDILSTDHTAWRRRIISEYEPIPGRRILLILPCSAKKPYSTSRTHQRIRDRLKGIKKWKGQVQQVVITSPLGAVPMELEDLFPASHYDIPVTGEWYPEELDSTREIIGSIFGKGEYDHVITFHREGGQFFPGEISKYIFKGASYMDIHSMADGEDEDPYQLLNRTLGELIEPGGKADHEREDLMALIRYSMNADLDDIPDLNVKWTRRGRELRKGKTPIIVFKKGGPVPTAAGGSILWDLPGKNGGKKVIIDDFKPKGTVFSQGILSVEGRVRSGDIVLVGTGSEFRGVGRALVPGDVMITEVPGPAVRIIHVSK
jgi:archaeosine synthase